MLKSTCFALLLATATTAGAVQAPSAAPEVVSVTTPAPAPEKAAPKKQDKNAVDLDKIVCEKQETTGTRLGARKICLTVAQWNEFRSDERDQLQHLQSNIGVASH